MTVFPFELRSLTGGADYAHSLNTAVRRFDGAGEDGYLGVCGELACLGCSFLYESETDGNRASFFEYGGSFVSCRYSPSESAVRVVFDESRASLPDFDADFVPGDYPVRLWQFEVGHALIDCGMCYIAQFSDGTFFIIDSAHIYSLTDDRRLADFLRERAPAGSSPRVRAWFFSHGHLDHIGKFLDVLRYEKDIRIDNLIYNFVQDTHPDSDCWDVSDRNHVGLFYRLTGESGIPSWNIHCGEKFKIGGLDFNVLCTHEEVFPASLDNYNDSSTVITLSAGEDRVCFPGDAGAEEDRILLACYPAAFRCDIMQAAHHGHFGLSSEFYRRAGAGVMLFPNTKIIFDEDYPRYGATRTACSLAEEYFISSDGTVEFTFPLAGSEIVVYPDETVEDFDGVYNLWSYEYDDAFKENVKKRFESRSVTERRPFPKKRKE